MPAEILAQVAGSYELPGEAVFPESIGVDAATGGAYVGSLALGTLYRLASAGTAELWAAGGATRPRIRGRGQGRYPGPTVGRGRP
jgi:hypothetical protein